MFGIGAEKPASLSEEKSRDQRDEHLDMMGQGDGPLYPMSRRQREDYELAKNWRELKHAEVPASRWQRIKENTQLHSMDKDEEALMQYKMSLPTMQSDRAMDAIETQLGSLPEDNFQRWQYLIASSRRGAQIVEGLRQLNQQTGDVWTRAKSLEQDLEAETFATLQSELAKRHSPLAETFAREGLPEYHRLVEKLGKNDLLRMSLPELCDFFEKSERDGTLSDGEQRDEALRMEARKYIGVPVRQFDEAAQAHEAAKSVDQKEQEKREAERLEAHQDKLADDIEALLAAVNHSDQDSPLLSEVAEYIDKGKMSDYLAKERHGEADDLSDKHRLMSGLGRQKALDGRLSDLYLTLIHKVEQQREPGMAGQILLEARAKKDAHDLIVENGLIHQGNIGQFSGKLLDSDYLPFKNQMDIYIQNTNGEVFRLSPRKNGWLLEGQRRGAAIHERFSNEDVRGFTWRKGAPWGFDNESMGDVAGIELSFKGSARVARKGSVGNKLAGNSSFIVDLPSRHFSDVPKQHFWQRWLPKRGGANQSNPRPV